VKARYETELANEYGNLASRTIAMVHRYRDGQIPTAPTDPELAKEFEALPDDVARLLERAEITIALERIWQLIRRLNRYVEERAPWQLARDPGEAAALDETLASLADGVRVVAVLLAPYMPATTEQLLGALGSPDTAYDRATFSARGSGAKVSALEPLFPKR
jgi:methionyl-tRNA synthetase